MADVSSGEEAAPEGSVSLPPFEVVAASLAGSWDPAIPIAASRSGATGLLDLSGLRDRGAAESALSRLFALWWDEHGQTAVDDGQKDRGHDVVDDNG